MKSKSLSKPTTLDFIILGLLQQAPQTGYRIRKAIEETALGNFGSSPGTIYPALKRLEDNQLVKKQSTAESSGLPFSITPRGMDQLATWLEQSPSEEDVKKNPELLVLKFAFMDPLLNIRQQMKFLDEMKQQLELYLQVLEEYLESEKDAMPRSGRLAFEHGPLSYRAHIAWCIMVSNELGHALSNR